MWVATRRNIPVAVMPWPERPGRVTVVAKLSFDVDPSGHAVLAVRPDPLTPDTLGPSGLLLFPSDFVRSKQVCDVFVVGRALTLPPAPTYLEVGSVAKRELHAATLGPVLVRSSAATVQHAPVDQRLERADLPLRVRYRRAGFTLDVTLPGPTPVVAVGRGGRVEPQRTVLDTVAIDPDRARVTVSIRAVIEELDTAGAAMVIIDEDAALPKDTSELVAFSVSEIGPTSAEVDAPAPRSTRALFEDLESETSVELPIDLARAVIDETVSIDGDPLEEDDPLARTVRRVPAMGLAPRLAPVAGSPSRPPSPTLPVVPSRAARAALPFARARSASEAASPLASAASAPPMAEPPTETTQLVPAVDLAPALPFATRPAASHEPPQQASWGTRFAVEETTADVAMPGDVGRETALRSGPPSRPALPFAGASGAAAPRPIPRGLEPATPFERKSAPPPAGPSALLTFGAPAASTPVEAPKSPLSRFNVGCDLKPIAQEAKPVELSRPTLSLETYAKVKAELWSLGANRREVLRRHGLSEIQWRLAERSILALGEDKAGGADDGSALRALIAGLASEVRRQEQARELPG